MNYYKGNFYKEQTDRHGWLVGSFMPAGDERSTDKFEAKFLTFKRGEDIKHVAKYQRSAIEYNFLLKGKIKGIIGSENVTLERGDYVVLPPGIVSNLPTEVLEDTEFFTIKSPSVPGDKIEVKKARR